MMADTLSAAARLAMRLTWQLSERAWWLAGRAALATWRGLRIALRMAFSEDAPGMPDPMPDARPSVPATAAVAQLAPHGFPPLSLAEVAEVAEVAEAGNDANDATANALANALATATTEPQDDELLLLSGFSEHERKALHDLKIAVAIGLINPHEGKPANGQEHRQS